MKHLFRIALIIVLASTFGNAQVKLKVLQPALSKWQIPVANYRLPGKLDWTMSYMSLQAALDSVGVTSNRFGIEDNSDTTVYREFYSNGGLEETYEDPDESSLLNIVKQTSSYQVDLENPTDGNGRFRMRSDYLQLRYFDNLSPETSELRVGKDYINDSTQIGLYFSTDGLIAFRNSNDQVYQDSTSTLSGKHIMVLDSVTGQMSRFVGDLAQGDFVTLDTEQEITGVKRFNYLDYQTSLELGTLSVTNTLNNDYSAYEAEGITVVNGTGNNYARISPDSIFVRDGTVSRTTLNKNGSIQLKRSGVTIGNNDVLTKYEIDSIVGENLINGLNWRGTFSAYSSYVINDAVLYARTVRVFTIDYPSGSGLPDDSNSDLWIYSGSTIRTGTGAPSGALGVQGDFYLDTATSNFYEKTGGLSYSIVDNLLGATGATGATGLQGVNNVDGAVYTFSNTTSAPPGSTSVRLNSATRSAVTAAYIHETAFGSIDVSAWLATINSSTSTNKAVITFSNLDASTNNYARYFVTGYTDNGDYVTLNLTYINNVGTLSTGVGNMHVGVSRVGNIGTTGTTGATGAQGADPADATLYTFDNSNTDSNPSVGFARLNNTTRSAVTQAFISKTANSGATVTDWLNTIVSSTSTNKAVIIFGRRDAFNLNYARYYVTGITDATGYVKLALTYIDHFGTLNTTGGNLLIGVSRTGNLGATGATGAAGQGFTFRGDWDYDPPINYVLNDVVRYDSTLYAALGANTADEVTDNPEDNPSNWGIFLDSSQIGADGNDGQGVPTGGTTGQLLAKIDATDYNTEWVDAPTGGGGGGEVRTVASNHTSSATAYAPFNVTVENGKSYRLRFIGAHRTSNNASRGNISIAVPTGSWSIASSRVYDPSNNTAESWGAVGTSSPIATNHIYSSTATSTDLRVEFDLIYTCTADGTIGISLSFFGNSAHITWMANSKLIIEEF